MITQRESPTHGKGLGLASERRHQFSGQPTEVLHIEMLGGRETERGKRERQTEREMPSAGSLFKWLQWLELG